MVCGIHFIQIIRLLALRSSQTDGIASQHLHAFRILTADISQTNHQRGRIPNGTYLSFADPLMVQLMTVILTQML